MSIDLVVFDLAGTTIHDDNDVAKCLHRGAVDVGIDVELELVSRNIGTNKVHLYQFLIEHSRGKAVHIADLERSARDPETLELAMSAFRLYEQYMIDHYREMGRQPRHGSRLDRRDQGLL